MWAAGANRLYYAAYYAVSALLLQKGYPVKTHDGVVQMFGKHFVKTGIVDREMGALYSKLFSLRLTGDYDDDYTITENDVVSKIEATELLITTVIELTNSNQTI